ncbi:Stage II sporulation protein D [Lentibacillus sp. JNUCC-1]|uniref:stage II sporulation protein D n=1 Tax=Lentibacillus sp. JNUCC-1 TaxID=2654513 RepID=UPI0012E72E1A|nr:stage II sporulation protein D [Lentibacillus sp. JNUCC-1]MUV37370.1 Stage II sporulation protein D [Lentibacillus sp. JNUCC-1]
MSKPFKPKLKTSPRKRIYTKVKQLQKKTGARPSTLRTKSGWKKPSWKLPGLVVFASLMAIILIIPTLIVVPFIESESTTDLVHEMPAPIEVEEGDEQLAVNVMRSGSEDIEKVPLENYVAGVVSAEMPAEFELEALKAQALAARTYIVNHLQHQENQEDAAITDTISHQVYKSDTELRERWGKDYNWKMERIREAVSETEGEVLTYNDVTITPAFFSTSNGYTENSEDYWENELPYLRSVESPWDTSSPKYLDQKTFTLEDIEQALGVQLPKQSAVPMTITRTESGRVQSLALGDETLSGRKVREKLDLRSSDFSIKQKNNHFIFTTKGFGHGIGMSQYGANGMAQEGKTYKDIVAHYYQDVKISSLAETVPTLVMADQEDSNKQ